MSELRCSRVRGPGFAALAWVHGVIVFKSCTRGCPCMRIREEEIRGAGWGVHALLHKFLKKYMK
jgi:hypothetical protein